MGEGTIQSGMQNCWRHPFLHHEKPVDQMLTSPPPALTFLIPPIMGVPLCSGVQAEQTSCATTTLEKMTQKESENEEAPKNVNSLPLAQHQTGETPLGWVNRMLCAFLRTFSGASLLDQGSDVEGKGCVKVSVSILEAEVLITLMMFERYN